MGAYLIFWQIFTLLKCVSKYVGSYFKQKIGSSSIVGTMTDKFAAMLVFPDTLIGGTFECRLFVKGSRL